MAYLRHSTRHAHQSLIDYLKYRLELLNWTDPDNVPFGSPAVVIKSGFPDEWDTNSVLDPGMLVITVGDEAPAREAELGPLASIEIPFFVDCFMDTDGVALALSCDVRDILTGRFAGTKASLPVYDYSDGEPFESGYVMEFEDTERDRVKNKWHVVKTSAIMYFNDVRQEEESS